MDTIKLDNKQSILNDRAFFNFPTYAYTANIKRNLDIADPNESANEETRIVLDIGDMRLVFFAQELFALGDKDLLTTITKKKEQEKMITKILTDKDDLQSILSTPTKFDSAKDPILVNSLVVRTEDNTLFQINAFINPAAYKFKDQFLKLTENVFSSLTKGTRKNNLGARQEKLKIYQTNKAFTVDLPANYCTKVEQEYGFHAFRFIKYQTYADINWIELKIYYVQYPSITILPDDTPLSKNDGREISGFFLNKTIDWLYFYLSEEGLFLKEQKISCDNIKKGLIVHIKMLSNQEKTIDDLTKIAESIKLTDE